MSGHPPKQVGISLANCRRAFEAEYCQRPIETFDGIEVKFRKEQFDHCFFESVARKDDTFSAPRAERVYWIKWALQNPEAELFLGWDGEHKRFDGARRVAVVNGDYVVVIRFTGEARASFVTAYVASAWTIGRIRLGPRWAKKDR